MFDLSNLTLFLADVVWEEHFDPKKFQDVAVQALVEGFDGPALREMAWLQDDYWTAEPLYRKALRELGYELPTRYEAWLTMLKACAAQIVAGTMGPAEGAYCLDDFAYRALIEKLIDHADYHAFDGLRHLSVALEDEDMNELPPDQRPPELAAQVMAMANALLRPVPKPWLDT